RQGTASATREDRWVITNFRERESATNSASGGEHLDPLPVRLSSASSYCSNSRRYSVGLVPLMVRKTRAKCCWVLKPQATATSSTTRFGITQHLLRALDSKAQYELMWALSRRIAEHLTEVGYAQVNRLCHFFKS